MVDFTYNTKKLPYNVLISWAPIGFSIFNQLNKIIDPEFPIILVKLKVIKIEFIQIFTYIPSQKLVYSISFFPTYGKCKLAPLLGINLFSSYFKRSTLKKLFKLTTKNWFIHFKVKLANKDHKIGENITKQLNDKERLSAAIENKFIRLSILNCVQNR
jgi:hypothetical protein|eukprot:Tamp_04236.p2 GENE.Tamp_04236~~Tamp_04236.p2  ORF type:complete len:158 (+),score=2.04 Tamp_04236:63-536(+)